MIILAAPLLISYLTWSTVDGGAKVMRAAAAVKAATSKKRSEVALPSATTRNPFSPVGSGGFLAAVLAEEREKAAATQAEEAADDILLKLNGTVITSKWRFAIINGDRVVEGQKYMGMTVEKIDPERVRLTNINGVPLDLGLQIEIVKASDATATQPSSQQSLPGISTLPAAGLPNILDALGIPQG
jgi:hypothetical protein